MEGANERKGSKYEDMEEEELPAVEHPGLSGVGGWGGALRQREDALDGFGSMEARLTVSVPQGSNLGSPA